ncbi:flagellar biosynthesis protein FlhA [Desulfatirhabdium butyrativorans]|uniref:flagellar biosynthesis protein FlhA n=1 Tax=Desulfatirhabdium butyrativorans TaxID=340467 RepID=UPI0003FDCE89|nr:flagellar biosynthesis protein FlhA [Desulfatirhabdium butyrativorans]
MEMAHAGFLTGKWSRLTLNTDVMMACAVVAILLIMLVPLPTWMLDILISFSITFSIVILLVGMYIHKPLELSAFPSILLITTLFRLSLNVASTRMILLHGNEGMDAAGSVIMAFGQFVVGGNYVVGIIVFLILVIINFVVITKGAGRIAEVAARFTLDAMPGKQMAIDADLNAGLISDQEAKQRRKLIAQEAEYYGAMDGANKFVRGDAIAGLIITAVNIVGGLGIGMLFFGMEVGNAAQNYTILTVGDGLVSQIPALIISTAAGIIVSRAGSEASLGKDISSQILVQPKAIGVSAVVLFGFGLIPGLPTIPFWTIALLSGGLAYALGKSSKKLSGQTAAAEAKNQAEAKAKGTETAGSTLAPLDILALEVGYGLIPLVDAEQNGELLDRIKAIRRQIAQEIGIVVPSVHIQDNIQLRPAEYIILLKGNEVARGELMIGHDLALNPGSAVETIEGIPTREPTFNLPAFWIREEERDNVIAKGYTVVDLATVLTTHLSEIIKRHAHEYLGRQEVQKLLDSVKESHPKVVEELVPALLPLGAVGKVLQNLLMEQIPIRDLLTILETLADYAPMTKDIDVLTEYVRHALARTITRLYANQDGTLTVMGLDPQSENLVSRAIQQTSQGSFLALDPDAVQRLVGQMSAGIEKFAAQNLQPVLMCSSQIRIHLKRLIDRFIPNMVVLSYHDVLTTTRIQAIATVRLTDAN